MKFEVSSARIKEIDHEKVHEVYRSWPKMAAEGAKVRVDFPLVPYSRAVYIGVGGSASAGDVISDWLKLQGSLSLIVDRGPYPRTEVKDTLVLACSVSGNTAETLQAANLALKRGGALVAISSGGALERFAHANNLPHVKIPRVAAPRYSFPHLLFTTLGILGKAFVIEGLDEDVSESLKALADVSGKIGVSTPTRSNPSKRLASSIWDSNPKVYGSLITRGVALRFKNALNENAKKHASVDSSPELFHNEVEAWEGGPDRFVPVFLRHTKETLSERRRIDSMIKLLRNLKARTIEEKGFGRSSLAELVTLVYLLDFASYYVAIANGVDPYPTRLLDALKREA